MISVDNIPLLTSYSITDYVYWVCDCVSLLAKLKETLNSYLRTVGPPKKLIYWFSSQIFNRQAVYFYCKNLQRGITQYLYFILKFEKLIYSLFLIGKKKKILQQHFPFEAAVLKKQTFIFLPRQSLQTF